MLKKNVALVTAAVIMLAAAAWLLFARGPSKAVIANTFALDGVCLACKQEARVTLKTSEREPGSCPACGQRAVYGWKYCSSCGYRFIPKLEQASDGPPRVPVIPSCPHCGSNATGDFYAADTSQEVKGTAPLPSWPP